MMTIEEKIDEIRNGISLARERRRKRMIDAACIAVTIAAACLIYWAVGGFR